MPTKCKVCEEKTNQSSYSFHSFPASAYRARKWLEALHLKHNFMFRYAVVCSRHFSADQFKENGKLKKDATPNINLPKKETVAVKRRRSPKKRETSNTGSCFVDINDCQSDNTFDSAEDPLEDLPEPSPCLGECSTTYRPADHQETEAHLEIDSSEDFLGAYVDVTSDEIVENGLETENIYSSPNEDHSEGDHASVHQAANLQINPFVYNNLNDVQFKYLTGHSKSEFDSIFDLVTREKEDKDFPFTILPLREQLLLTLAKCRMNFDYFMLGMMFNLTPKKVSEVFKFWINLLHKMVMSINFWSLRAQSENLYTVVLDCTEFPIHKPTSPEEQQITWSSYKNTNTFKALIGTDERGMVTFVSEVYGGAITDNLIVEKSNILEYLKTGDYVLSDRGFEMTDLLAERGIILNKPPNKRGNQMPETDVTQTRAIASRRVHVERVIGFAKKNRIISQRIPHYLFDLMPKIIPLLFFLLNFKPKICEPVESKCLCHN